MTRGPIRPLPPDFQVLVIPRSPDSMAYATRCMSQPEDDERLELHVLAPHDRQHDSMIVELLTVVAHFHRTGARLGLGHTVNFGRPWLPGSLCSYGLISLPYLDGPTLEWEETTHTRFLWLIPITEAEKNFKVANGVDALEQRFEEASFHYLDPLRPSVV
jgi:hypothetical protein